MNEQIRLLADEAGLRLTQLLSNPTINAVHGKESELERFAESIIQECVDIAHANADVDETYDYACHTIAWKIQEHFGVEE